MAVCLLYIVSSTLTFIPRSPFRRKLPQRRKLNDKRGEKSEEQEKCDDRHIIE